MTVEGASKSFYAGAKFESHPPCVVLPTPPSHWTAPIQRSQSQPSTPTIKSAQNSIPVDLASLFRSPNPVKMAKSFPGNGSGFSLMVSNSSNSVFPGERSIQVSASAAAKTTTTTTKKYQERRTKKSVVESESSDEELKEILNKGAKKAFSKKEVVPKNQNQPIAKSPAIKSKNVSDMNKVLGMIATSCISAKDVKLEAERRLNLSCHGAPLNNYKEMSDQLKSMIKISA